MKKVNVKIEEYAFKILMWLSTLCIIGILCSILWAIFAKGLSSLSWEMLTSLPKGGFYFGKEGGIANAIVGSLYLAFGATLLSIVISIPTALYMNVQMRNKRKRLMWFRFFLDILWGVPSIVYGAFGFSLMLMLGMKTSLLAGIIVLGIFVTPIMIRSIDEILKTVPIGLNESAYSLGMTKTETGFKFLLRKVLPGVITAVILSFGRAIGDSAIVLFTAGYTDYIPNSVTRQVASLPLAIFFQLSSPVEEVKNRAYAAALILTIFVLIISLSARFIGRYYQNKNNGRK